MYAPVRGGNRGGADQFKWDDVRLMPYKDRECYLGASEKLGYLDKGGKWRKRDWWLEDDKNGEISQKEKEQLRREIEHIKKEDEALMRVKLGLDPYQETKVVLQAIQENQNSSRMTNKLTEYELKELTQRGGASYDMGEYYKDEKEYADRMGGLGTEEVRNQQSSKNKAILDKFEVVKNEKDLNQLEGVGVDDLKYMDQRKKLILLNYLKDKLEQEKQEKKERKELKKKEKKEKKKERKEKKKHHHKDKKKRRERSSSSESKEREIIQVKDKGHRDHKDNSKEVIQPKDIEKQKSNEKRRDRSRSRDRERRDRHHHERSREDHRDDYNHKKYDSNHRNKPRERSRSHSVKSSSSKSSSSSFLSE